MVVGKYNGGDKGSPKMVGFRNMLVRRPKTGTTSLQAVLTLESLHLPPPLLLSWAGTEFVQD